jgi:ABC-type multidrug transport system fused ATPase/permease subunit
MVDRSSAKQKIFDLNAWRYFLRFFQGRLSIVVISSLASTLQAVLVLPLVLLIRYVFDTAIPRSDVRSLILCGCAIFAVNLAGAGIAIWVNRINFTVVHAVISILRQDLVAKLFGFSREFYTHEDLKVVHTRIVQDTERLSNLCNSLIAKFMPAVFLSVTLCLLLLWLNWLLFIVLAVLFPVLFLLHRYMGQRVKSKVYVFQRAFEAFSRGIFFVLRFIDLTRIQTAERDEIERQNRHIGNLANTSTHMHFYYALNGQLHTLITGVSGVVIIVLGGIAIAAKTMTIGDFFAFYVATGYLYRHVAVITDSFMQIVAGNASMVTLKALAESDRLQPQFGSWRVAFSGRISFGASLSVTATAPYCTRSISTSRPDRRPL